MVYCVIILYFSVKYGHFKQITCLLMAFILHENHVDGDTFPWARCSPLKTKSVGMNLPTSKRWNYTCFGNKTVAMTTYLFWVTFGIDVLKESEGAQDVRVCCYKYHWDEMRESKGNHSDNTTWGFLHCHCLWHITSICIPMHGCFVLRWGMKWGYKGGTK